ncbi:LacI family transcriptional regulator [Trinickia symbiotica]|uniref:LacI family transcriptional regulator n=1 Tax=Trinickia symbiotica TaxID=863227 RepID=A0A2T3XZV3_9BURK|nr:LacI family DNA-binding transcriptional regulator [Trinickia symbiotica]PTB22018.1 LacI family transcriptional regulator [Trinickia symbiotica]
MSSKLFNPAATIKDVAAQAGVSVMTVSNVLRGRGRVSEETRRRVLETAERQGYRPNLTARALVERKAPTLALMLSCITNPFYPEFALAANLQALKHERHLLVCNTDHELDRGTGFLEQVAGSLSDGVLVANNADLPIDELRALQERGIPVVISVWERPDEPPGIPCVTFDSKGAGRLAAQHLVEYGHRRIGAIVGSPKHGIHGGRYAGFREVVRAAKIRQSTADERFTEDSFEHGYEAAKDLLSARPDLTAIFVSNDLPALGVLNAASDLGFSVPGDLSVVSITDIIPARQSRPGLTTVAIPTAEMAEKGVNLLVELMAGRATEATVVHTSAPKLVVRGSTARLR